MSERLLTVKEFDVITCNPEYKNDRYLKYLPEQYFREFDDFIRRQGSGEGESSGYETLDFFRAYVKKGVGNVIQARNYVGMIQLESGYQIQILPKIYFEEDEDPELATTRVFMRMLKELQDFPGKIFNSANLRTESMNIYEIFIAMYVQQVSGLTKRGLKSAYLPTEDNLNYHKGKLLINQQIKRNLSHQERFYVAYDEFSLNRPENRLIKSTLLKLQKVSEDPGNVKAIRQLLPYFELVEPSVNYDKDFSSLVNDRNTRDYRDIMVWSKIFLKNKSFSAFAGDVRARTILFPMEKLYESYVAQNMERILEEYGWNMTAQDRRYYLFREDYREIFELQQDIVITRPDGSRIIMDTKWKRLNTNREANYGISQADMYQMFAYAKRYETPDIWLLYPLTEEVKTIKKDIVFRGGGPDRELTVSVFFVDVAEIQKSLEELLRRV